MLIPLLMQLNMLGQPYNIGNVGFFDIGGQSAMQAAMFRAKQDRLRRNIMEAVGTRPAQVGAIMRPYMQPEGVRIPQTDVDRLLLEVDAILRQWEEDDEEAVVMLLLH